MKHKSLKRFIIYKIAGIVCNGNASFFNRKHLAKSIVLYFIWYFGIISSDHDFNEPDAKNDLHYP
jgi:hypothetical protein